MTDKKRKTIKRIMIIIGIIAAVLLILMFILFPPSFGNIRNSNGDEICEKTFLDINGTKLGMVIKGSSKDKPVMLLMGGGPGIPEYWLEYEYPTGLDEDFIVCYPCYRGTALSYDPDIPKETVSNEQYLDDADKITDYLRERFGQNKIWLMGHSFGTKIALQMADRHPEKYEAYIGMSITVDQYKSERLAFWEMLDKYKADGSKSMVEDLEKYSELFADPDKAPDRSDSKLKDYYRSIRDKAMHKIGGGSLRDMKSVITGIFFPSLRMTDFTQSERLNIWKGKSFVNDCPIGKEEFFNAFEQVSELKIPVYVFAGKYDLTTVYSVQKEYFDFVKADIKGFYTFDESAHSPLFEESDKAREILRSDILNKKTDMSDK